MRFDGTVACDAPLSCAARAASDSRSQLAERDDRVVDQRERLPLLAPAQADHRELGLDPGLLGTRPGDRSAMPSGALEGGDGAVLVAEQVLGHAEVTGGQRRGAADQHAAERFDLLEQVERAAARSPVAPSSLCELDREHGPRVAAHHRFAIGSPGSGAPTHGEAPLARGDPAGEEVDARLLERVGGLGPGGERLARLRRTGRGRRTRHASGGRNSPAAQW